MVDGIIATARRRVTLEELKTALRALLPSLEREYGVSSIEIFGSYVRGEQDEESDLDLLVEFDPEWDLSLFDFARLQRTLGESLGVRVDLVEKRSIKPRLRDRILHEAIPLRGTRARQLSTSRTCSRPPRRRSPLRREWTGTGFSKTRTRS
ncbi:MAG: nucleotidyltransferase family protein [Methanospirillum sp.]